MQLTYRGQAYEVSNPAVDGTPTGETATFMGHLYPRKQFSVTQRQQSAELIYRGVQYTR